MEKLRIAAHFIFGIALGGSVSYIGIYNDWRPIDFWLFAILISGVLLSTLAEFAQAWNYTRIHPGSEDTFQINDVIKNVIGSFIGSVILYVWHPMFYVSLPILGLFVIYAVVRFIQRKGI